MGPLEPGGWSWSLVTWCLVAWSLEPVVPAGSSEQPSTLHAKDGKSEGEPWCWPPRSIADAVLSSQPAHLSCIVSKAYSISMYRDCSTHTHTPQSHTRGRTGEEVGHNKRASWRGTARGSAAHAHTPKDTRHRRSRSRTWRGTARGSAAHAHTPKDTRHRRNFRRLRSALIQLPQLRNRHALAWSGLPHRHSTPHALSPLSLWQVTQHTPPQLRCVWEDTATQAQPVKLTFRGRRVVESTTWQGAVDLCVLRPRERSWAALTPDTRCHGMGAGEARRNGRRRKRSPTPTV